MPRRKQALFTLNTGIFPATVLFCYGMKHEEICAKLLTWDRRIRYWHAGIKDEDGYFKKNDTWGFVLKRVVFKGKEEKTLFYIVLKNEFKFKDFDYISLAHEVTHLCQFILADILDRNKEIEAEAYLHTHLMGLCLKAIRQAK